MKKDLLRWVSKKMSCFLSCKDFWGEQSRASLSIKAKYSKKQATFSRQESHHNKYTKIFILLPLHFPP
jgi:hypothetical protein